MDAFIKALVDQGGFAILAAAALILVSKVWELRCKDKDEMIMEMKARNDKLMVVVQQLAEALGKNSAVIERNSEAFDDHTKAFISLEATLKKVNGKPQSA